MIPHLVSQFARWLSCVVCLAAGCAAAELLDPPEVAGLTGTSATVRWHTEVPTGTRVHFGVAPNQLTKSVEGEVTVLHEAVLGGLQPGTTYFFTVGTARKVLTTGQFTTLSSPAGGSSPDATSPVEKVRIALGRWLGKDPKAPPPQASPVSERVPTARATWGNPASLQDHFDRHGADFGAKSPEDYAAQAWRFRQRARSGGLRVKVDDEGVQRVFDPATGAFAAYNRDGTTKTFFKPGSRDYFTRQPGQPAKTVTP